MKLHVVGAVVALLVIGCAADGHDKHDRTKASADVSATKFTVTPISCSGSGPCSLDQENNGPLRAKVNGTCPSGYQESSANSTQCEKPCPAGYTTSYSAPATRGKFTAPQTVVCTQTACPPTYTFCKAAAGAAGYCLPPHVATPQAAAGGDLCAALSGNKTDGMERSFESIKSCRYKAAPGNCTAGAAVCLAPVAVECPGGYEVTPDNSSCIRCLPGMNVSASEPYTCQGACKGERFNETCFASCNRGHSFHEGRCYQPCGFGDSAANATTCAVSAANIKKGKKAGSYKRDFNRAPVLPTSTKPYDKKAPRTSGGCPKGMSMCGHGKCAANIYGASGCLVFASLTATNPC